MMKRLILLLLLVFLSACDVESEEVVLPPVVTETPEVIEEESSIDVTSPNIAVMGADLPRGSFDRFVEKFGDDLQWYSLFDVDRIPHYEKVFLFYDAGIENLLKAAGYEWPKLEANEVVRVSVNDSTDVIFVELSDVRYRLELVKLLLSNYSSISQDVVSLWSYLELPKDEKGTVLQFVDICRLEDLYQPAIRIGFPMSPRRLPSNGIVNVQVLFTDFPDYPGTKTPEEINDFFYNYIEGIENFFQIQSMGRVSFEWMIEPEFIRIPRNIEELNLTRNNQSDLESVLRQAVRISNQNVDYTDIDMVIVFMNPDIPESLADVSPAWPLEDPLGIATKEKTIYNATFIAGDGVRIGYSIIAHEIGHLFGLVDLYKYNWLSNNPERDSDRQFEYTGVFDFMNFAPPSQQHGDNRDMLGWQRWLLNWIIDDEVQCILANQKSISMHTLSPVSEEGDTRLLLIKLTDTQVLAVEVRKQNTYCEVCSGGVYTYLVDISIPNGSGPLQLLRPEHSTMSLFQDAYLSPGQSITFNNVTIQVESQEREQVVVSVLISE